MSSAQRCVTTTATILASIRPGCLCVDRLFTEAMNEVWYSINVKCTFTWGPLRCVVHRMRTINSRVRSTRLVTRPCAIADYIVR